MLTLLAFVLMSCSTTDTDTGDGTDTIVPLPNELTGTWELSEGELTAIDGTTGTTLDSFFIFKDDKTLTIKGNTGTVLATAKIESSENLSLALGSDPAEEVGVAFAKFDATSAIHADKYIAFTATDYKLYMSRIGDSIADVKANLLLTDPTKGGLITAFGNSSVATEPTFIANSDTLVESLQGDWGLSRTALKDIAGTEKVANYSFYNIVDKAVTIKNNKTGAPLGTATIEDAVSKMRVNHNVIDVYTLAITGMTDKVVFYMDGDSIVVSPVGTIEAIKAEVSRKPLTKLLQLSDKLTSAPTFKDFATVYPLFKGGTWVGGRTFENVDKTPGHTLKPSLVFGADNKVALGGSLGTADIKNTESPEKLRVTLDGIVGSIIVDVIWSTFTEGFINNGKYVGYFIVDNKLYSTAVGTQEEIRADLLVSVVKLLSSVLSAESPLDTLKADLVGTWASSVTEVKDYRNGSVIPTDATYIFAADGTLTITDSSGTTLMTATLNTTGANPAFPTIDLPHPVINNADGNGITSRKATGALVLDLSVGGVIGAFVDNGKLYITQVAPDINQFEGGWGGASHEGGRPGYSVYGVVAAKS